MTANFQALVDAVISAETAGAPRHELILELGETPALLLKYGFAQLPLIVKAKTIGKAYFDHCIDISQIKRLPSIVDGPKAIYRSHSRPNDAVVVMTYETHMYGPVIVPVSMNQLVGRDTVNEVSSMYAKQGPDPEAKWTAAGLLLWKSGKKKPI